MRILLPLVLLALPLAAAASQPGEGAPPAPAVDNPIHHSPDRQRVAAATGPTQVTPMAVLNYQTFEATVDHGDLAECPRALAAEGRFCRAVLHGESIHVFAFAEDGEQPLQAVAEYPLDQVDFGD